MDVGQDSLGLCLQVSGLLFARGLPCLFLGDLNIEATKIPF